MIKWINKNGYVYVISFRSPQTEHELSYHWYTSQGMLSYYISRAWYYLSGIIRKDQKASETLYKLFNK